MGLNAGLRRTQLYVGTTTQATAAWPITMLEFAPAMQLVHLSLTNFRNFIRLEMDFQPGTTLVIGPNAQGKTSLLEAIDYLVDAASSRSASDRELINFLVGAEPGAFARIVAEIRRGDQPQRLEIRLIADAGRNGGESRILKEILLNGVRRRAGDLAGVFNAVLFLPEDLRVLEGPPAERRRFLDRTLAQADSAYAQALSEFNRALTQRNALLRQLQDRGGDPGQLEVWDSPLIESAAKLVRTRAVSLAELERLAQPIHASLTRGTESLRLTYRPSGLARASDGQMALPLEDTEDWAARSQVSVADGLRRALAAARPEELARGMTVVGPHRDDFRFLAEGVDLRSYGSRGQNRTAMISSKLAQAEWLYARTGEWPVLLLDETLAELDQARRNDVLERVGRVPQSVWTAADLRLFPPAFLASGTVWELRAGTLSMAQDPIAPDL